MCPDPTDAHRDLPFHRFFVKVNSLIDRACISSNLCVSAVFCVRSPLEVFDVVVRLDAIDMVDTALALWIVQPLVCYEPVDFISFLFLCATSVDSFKF